ncbi:D-inositol-3-phosphate glycosyltransferase [uncultured archaeon]|nr:D-inositol-3-phosphate glycosyltransferase [uncultured archaeon]
MLGWEFPPAITGGLATHCYHLTKALAKQNISVTFVMTNRRIQNKYDWLNLVQLDAATVLGNYDSFFNTGFFNEVYKINAGIIRKFENEHNFDAIHCQDWLTSIAGRELKKKLGIPLIMTIHATEDDRTGGHPWNQILELELQACREADAIITVSNYTKKKLESFGIPYYKITVIYNSVPIPSEEPFKQKTNKVLFAGRLTVQKGVEFFLKAAKLVLEKKHDVQFLIAGKGELLPKLIELTFDLGIEESVSFLGFVDQNEIKEVYKQCDIFVMPSVSEPFGIVALESMAQKTPIIISKTSGVAEVAKTAIRIDFWDTEKMAASILSALTYQELREEMAERGFKELRNYTWDDAGRDTKKIYEQAIGHG